MGPVRLDPEPCPPLFSCLGPDLGISVGGLTLPEVVWNRNLGVFKSHCDPPLPPDFSWRGRKTWEFPKPHRSTSPLPKASQCISVNGESSEGVDPGSSSQGGRDY